MEVSKLSCTSISSPSAATLDKRDRHQLAERAPLLQREQEVHKVLVTPKIKTHLILEVGLFQTTTRLFSGSGELTSRNNYGEPYLLIDK